MHPRPRSRPVRQCPGPHERIRLRSTLDAREAGEVDCADICISRIPSNDAGKMHAIAFGAAYTLMSSHFAKGGCVHHDMHHTLSRRVIDGVVYVVYRDGKMLPPPGLNGESWASHPKRQKPYPKSEILARRCSSVASQNVFR